MALHQRRLLWRQQTYFKDFSSTLESQCNQRIQVTKETAERELAQNLNISLQISTVMLSHSDLSDDNIQLV